MSAELLRDLARARAAFQLRAIETIITGDAIAAGSGTVETGETPAQCEASQSGGNEDCRNAQQQEPSS